MIEEEIALYTREGIANPAVTTGKKSRQQEQEEEQQHEREHSGQRKQADARFRASLEQSLFSSLPDSSALLRDLQEGVFRRLDDSCRLLAQGQTRDDLHFWKDLFAYCALSKQQQQPQQTGKHRHLQQRQEHLAGFDEYLLFCLKGAHGMHVAEAAANGRLLQQLQHADLTSIGLVAAHQLAARGPGNAQVGTAAAGKVQERVFAVKHFAGTVLYGTDGWLELNNDRVRDRQMFLPPCRTGVASVFRPALCRYLCTCLCR